MSKLIDVNFIEIKKDNKIITITAIENKMYNNRKIEVLFEDLVTGIKETKGIVY